MGIPLNFGYDQAGPGRVSRAEYPGVIVKVDSAHANEEKERLFQEFLLLVNDMERK